MNNNTILGAVGVLISNLLHHFSFIFLNLSNIMIVLSAVVLLFTLFKQIKNEGGIRKYLNEWRSFFELFNK